MDFGAAPAAPYFSFLMCVVQEAILWHETLWAKKLGHSCIGAVLCHLASVHEMLCAPFACVGWGLISESLGL